MTITAPTKQRGRAGRDTEAVTINGLVKYYPDPQGGSFAAVDGIDLTVGRGEVLSILGPNGAGKTTTVEIIEGRTPADAGTVRVLGIDPFTEPD